MKKTRSKKSRDTVPLRDRPARYKNWLKRVSRTSTQLYSYVFLTAICFYLEFLKGVHCTVSRKESTVKNPSSIALKMCK
jgi:hypothetical protein